MATQARLQESVVEDRASVLGTMLRRLPLAIPVMLLPFLSAFLVDTDPDYWWHLRTGRLILETHSLPRDDIFSYTAQGRPWVAHEWLSEVLFALVAGAWGYAGNAILFGLTGAIIALCVYLTCRTLGLGDAGAALIGLWSFAVSFPVTNWRPQLLTTALLALFTLLLTSYRRGHTRALWAIPPLMVLWVNAHGGYVIGLALLGLTAVGDSWQWYRQRNSPSPRALLVTCLLTAAATLASPLGLEGLRYPFLYIGSESFALRHIADFQSPNFHEAAYLPLALGLLAAAAVGIHRAPFTLTETLWSATFTLLALQSVRHGQLYAVVVLPLLGARLAAQYRPRLDAAGGTARRLVHLMVVLLLWLPPALTTGALAAGGEGARLQLGTEPSAASYPGGAADYLVAHDLRGNLFNEYQWGGYLIYRLYPEHRVYIDGRADVYGDAFIVEYQQLVRLQVDWQPIFDQRNIRLAVVGKTSPLARALRRDPAWQEVYSGSIESLFVRPE